MKKIIVPSDFTPVADSAITYAININKTLNYDIVLLHIAKNEAAIAEAREHLQKQVDSFKSSTGFALQTEIRVGNIFEDIGKISNELKAEMIVMGTHGLRGLMQFIVGGNALRIISSSDVPVIVTQSENKKTAIHRILVSLDLNLETKQVLQVAKDVANLFNAEIFITSPNEKDEFLRNRILRNLQFAEEYFGQHGLSYNHEFIETESDYTKEVIKYARYKNIDLICIMNDSEDQFIHAFGIDREQKMITNDSEIPVLVMNEVQVYSNDGTIFNH